MSNRIKWVFALGILFSVLIKVFLSRLGYNYDVISYDLVSKIVLAGESVYANTERYNYGPFWFYILGALKWITILIYKDSITALHMAVSLLLALTDVVISLLIYKKWGFKPAFLFIINPVSMVISGFHSQFDNIAILFSLLAMIVISEQTLLNLKRIAIGSMLLGVSLIFKHNYIFLPFWLFILGVIRRSIGLIGVSVVSVAMFILSFLHWIFDQTSRSGIINNVVKYSSRSADTILEQILKLILPLESIQTTLNFLDNKNFFLFALLVSVVIPALKKSTLLETWLFYTLCLFCFTSAMANQYLIIPLIPLCVFYSTRLWAPYFFLSFIYLAMSPEALGNILNLTDYFQIVNLKYYNLQFWVFCLLITLIIKKSLPYAKST